MKKSDPHQAGYAIHSFSLSYKSVSVKGFEASVALDNAFNKLAMNGKGVPLSGRTVSLYTRYQWQPHRKQVMMRDTDYILALCLTASEHVLAHGVWTTGKQAENNVAAEIGYGHNFPSKGTIPDRRDFFENPRLYDGEETITPKPASTGYVYRTEPASKDNGYVLSMYIKPGYWSRTSSEWKPVSRGGRNNVTYCEFVTEYTKSFIPGEQQMPAQLCQSPTGHELEIILLSDISCFSENMKLKVLYKTSPLAGTIMELNSVSYLTSSRHIHAVEHKHPVHRAELTFVANEDGIVTVPSLHIGQWLAKVQSRKGFRDRSLCNETADVATLSFSRN